MELFSWRVRDVIFCDFLIRTAGDKIVEFNQEKKIVGNQNIPKTLLEHVKKTKICVAIGMR